MVLNYMYVGLQFNPIISLSSSSSSIPITPFASKHKILSSQKPESTEPGDANVRGHCQGLGFVTDSTTQREHTVHTEPGDTVVRGHCPRVRPTVWVAAITSVRDLERTSGSINVGHLEVVPALQAVKGGGSSGTKNEAMRVSVSECVCFYVCDEGGHRARGLYH
jgi:hypothetical protein